MFKTIGTKDRLVDRVAEEIQNMILREKMPPGTKLPPERDLCEQLAVSRTVVREATRMLVSKGLLESRPGVGTIVRQFSADQITEPLSLLMQTYGETITLDHVHQVRQTLEVENAKIAARQATLEDLAHLRNLFLQMEQARDDWKAFAQLDTDFHAAISETTHNPLLNTLLGSLHDLLDDMRMRVHQAHDMPRIVIPDHQRILERIEAGDPEGAAQAMREHLENARKIQREVINGPEK